MKKIDIEGRVVLVTGASAGIGRAIGASLAARGVQVLACARKARDIQILSAMPNVRGLGMDVTSIAQIKAVAQLLTDEGLRLYALVNNAGIAVGGPLLTLPEHKLEECLAVNTIGPANVVRELYPYLEEEGCIVNISSMGARYISPWMAPYHMSKVALEAYTDSLLLELSPFGIRVVAVEPGAVKTKAFEDRDRFLGNMEATIYEKAFRRYWARISEQHQHALPPARIADVVVKILQDPKPKRRYLIPHRPIVRLMILLSNLGLSDLVYRPFLREVEKVPPSYFLDQR